MLVIHEYSVEFLNDKLAGAYVELNPVTGKPRLIKGLNEVWEAVERFGGITFTADHFGVSKDDVYGWIDCHYIPPAYAAEIAKKLGCEPNDFQEPSLGYDDPETCKSWPISWQEGWVEIKCN